MDVKHLLGPLEGAERRELQRLVKELKHPLLGVNPFGSRLMREELKRMTELQDVVRHITPVLKMQEQIRRLHLDFRTFGVSGLMGHPLSRMAAEAREHLECQTRELRLLGVNEEWADSFAGLADRITVSARVNLKLPELARVAWPADIFRKRTSLVTDSFRNLVSLVAMNDVLLRAPAELYGGLPDRVSAASRFVTSHATFVRQLPPRIQQDDAVAEESEEIGPRIDRWLAEIDPRLVELRQRAWQQLRGADIAGARMAMLGARELFKDVLHLAAPDEEIEKTDLWANRQDRKLTKPTRRMRLEYLVGPDQLEELDAMFQFDSSVNRAHRFAHTFAEDADLVRVHVAHLENWLYLVLLHARKRRGS